MRAQLTRAEARRSEAIRRFVLKQQGRRQFIGFADMAEHMMTASGVPLAAAFDKLRDAVLLGTFEQDGRPTVLHITAQYLATVAGPRPAHRYLTASLLADAIEVYGGDCAPTSPLVLDFLACAWLAAAAARRWLKRSGYGWPAHFEPESGISWSPHLNPERDHATPPPSAMPSEVAAPTTGAGRKKASGRPPKVRPRVEAAMRDDIERGEISVEQLREMLGKELRARYGASRSVCREARAAVLFVGNASA